MNGIPSPDTLQKVVERLDPNRFLEAFLSWSTDLRKLNPKQINVDGKSLRKALDERGALHLVFAFALDSGITLGCTDAGGRAKGISAIQSQLNALVLKMWLLSMLLEVRKI